MRILLWIGLGLVSLVAVVAVVGWLLPVGHVASRSASVNRPPADVYALVADVASYAQWWSDISTVEMLPADPGIVRFREHMTTGPVVMEVAEAVPPQRFVTRIADPDQPFGGTWTFEIAPENGGSRLTITERGEVYNPIFRFMSRFIFGQTATMESFLKAAASQDVAAEAAGFARREGRSLARGTAARLRSRGRSLGRRGSGRSASRGVMPKQRSRPPRAKRAAFLPSAAKPRAIPRAEPEAADPGAKPRASDGTVHKVDSSTL